MRALLHIYRQIEIILIPKERLYWHIVFAQKKKLTYLYQLGSYQPFFQFCLKNHNQALLRTLAGIIAFRRKNALNHARTCTHSHTYHACPDAHSQTHTYARKHMYPRANARTRAQTKPQAQKHMHTCASAYTWAQTHTRTSVH